MQGAQVLKITSTVIEACGGKGIDCQAGVGVAVQAWNMILDGVYFEQNTGTDLDLQSTLAGWCDATLIGCTFVNTSTIALGIRSRVLILGSMCGGGNECTITGTSWAQATLLGSGNFIKSGTFFWFNLGDFDSLNTTVPYSYTPTWGSLTGGAPAIGDGTLTGSWTKIGKQVTALIRLVVGASTTFGGGDWYFTLPYASASDYQLGDLLILDVAAGWYYGHASTAASSTGIMVNIPRGATAAAGLNAAFPMTWTTGDTLSINITYWV